MTSSSPSTLRVRSLTKRYGDIAALDDVSLELPADRYVCIMGPSGGGKSTLLRLIGGHERPDAGEIEFCGQSWTALPPERRPVHTVFQRPALFPHLDVRQNVAFAGRIAGQDAKASAPRVDEGLREVGLDPSRFGARRPHQLSGGEQARVALARALFGEPRLLLLDEPLAALDRPRRASLRRRLSELQRSRAIGFVHVTHDPLEAMAVADHLVVMAHGRVIAQGSPAELYARPPSLTVAQLLGDLVEVEAGRWLRPEHVQIRSDTSGRLAVHERKRVAIGDRAELTLDVEGRALCFECTTDDPAPVASLDWADANVFEFAP